MRMKKPEDRKVTVNIGLSPDLVIEINKLSGEFSRSSTVEGMLRDHIAQLKDTKPLKGRKGRTTIVTLAIDEQVLADVQDHTAEGISLSYAIETMLTRYMTAVEDDPHLIYG